jgi:hypothetical protein
VSWDLKYEGAAPQPPEPVTPELAEESVTLARLRERLFKEGCWQVLVKPDYADTVQRHLRYGLRYRGTLRVAWEGKDDESGFRASGDLYRDLDRGGEEEAGLKDLREIPIYPHSEYRYYFRLEGLRSEGPRDVRFELDVFRFSQESETWGAAERLTAELAAIPRKETKRPKLAGVLRNSKTTIVATFEMRRISKWLRRATVLTNHVKDRTIELPKDELERLFRDARWKLTQSAHGQPLLEPKGSVWSPQQLHEAMRQMKSEHSAELEKKRGAPDDEWLYMLLSVRKTAARRYGPNGIMFDAWPADTDGIPREGAAVACKSRCPLDEIYGHWAGRVLQDCEGKLEGDEKLKKLAYLRTAAHELGHAMGLAHNFAGSGFMQGLGNLARMAQEEHVEVPEMVRRCMRLDKEDVHRLRHLPDAWVRPGGVRFLDNFAHEPVPLDDLTIDLTKKEGGEAEECLELRIAPTDRVLPLGAPLRLTFSLCNASTDLDQAVKVPPSIGLGSGRLSGSVTLDGGTKRHFATVVRPLLDPDEKVLEPGKAIIQCETLLRGPEGALLPSPGCYRIDAEVAWEVLNGGRKRVRGSTTVLVTAPERRRNAECALEVLSCRQLMLPLVFHEGGPEEDALGALQELRKMLTGSSADVLLAVDGLEVAVRDPLCRDSKTAWSRIDLLARALEKTPISNPAKARDAIRILRETLRHPSWTAMPVLQSAISNDLLGDHFRVIEVRRLATISSARRLHHSGSEAEWAMFEPAAKCLLDGDPRMTGSEVGALARDFADAPRQALKEGTPLANAILRLAVRAGKLAAEGPLISKRDFRSVKLLKQSLADVQAADRELAATSKK